MAHAIDGIAAVGASGARTACIGDERNPAEWMSKP